MSVLFYDGVCPKPYDTKTLRAEAMGGTEATVVRVAEGLARALDYVEVRQHNRVDGMMYGANWLGPTASKMDMDAVVCLRDPAALTLMREQYPNAKLFLWCHDVATASFCAGMERHGGPDVTVIAVSDWHKSQILQALRMSGYSKGLKDVVRIYNPVEIPPKLCVRPAQVMTKDLVYFSSPHKGLERTLDVFAQLHSHDPEFRLYIANPGYYPSADVSLEGVVNLGTLIHEDVIAAVRRALCVLHVNTVFPETFGLVYAEANAVGTPFLTHDMGAVRELIDHPSELVNCFDDDAIINRVLAWSKGARPKVFAKPAFALARIAKEWEALLNG